MRNTCETSRTFGERYKEHLKEPSPIYGHSNISGHSTNPDNFTIIGRVDHVLARTIKESIYIRIMKPTLNGNVVKYNLHHILESCLAPLSLELTMMHTEQPLVHMFRPSQPIGMCITQQNILDMLRKHHHLNMYIEHHRTHIRC